MVHWAMFFSNSAQISIKYGKIYLVKLLLVILDSGEQIDQNEITIILLLHKLHMVLHNQHVLLLRMRKFNRRVVTFLRPEYRHTPPNDHMGNQIVMADKNFLSLDKVSGIKVDINAS